MPDDLDTVEDEVLALVTDEEGRVHLKLGKVKEKKEPWRVGVTEDGDNVFAPVSGPNATKVLHLKSPVAVCHHCRCTVHRRNAVVDPMGRVYCKPHWPHGPFEDPREPRLTDGTPTLTDGTSTEEDQ